ncbi:protein of unknown function [Hyphomicrobium sp. MC1]|nr:protein of unknown function [Hyphomicrobium sp. MC1]
MRGLRHHRDVWHQLFIGNTSWFVKGSGRVCGQRKEMKYGNDPEVTARRLVVLGPCSGCLCR